MRYWVSWIQKTEDYRPLTFPPNRRILGWWCSGYDYEGDNEYATICTLIEADCIAEATASVLIDWPESIESGDDFRFFEEKSDDWLPGDRFPFSDWMNERLKMNGIDTDD